MPWLNGKVTWFSWQSVLTALRVIGIGLLIAVCITLGLLAIEFVFSSWVNSRGSLVTTVLPLIVAASLTTLLVYAHRNKWDSVVWISAIGLVLFVGVLLSASYWDDLRGSEGSLSETVRNVGLLIGGVIAALLAMWRSAVAERQADIAQQGMLGERYQKGADMLSSEVLSVRLGGIYTLSRLAKEHPEGYHIQAMELLCAFARHPTKDEQVEMDLKEDEDDKSGQPRLRADVEIAIRMIAFRGDEGIALERREDFRLYLRNAKLAYLENRDAQLARAWLSNADLSNANLRRGDLTYARLRNANLSGAKLWNVNLRGANLQDANLDGADLTGADLTNLDMSTVDFESSTGGKTIVTQVQLDMACADPDNPPDLEGVVDADTGEAIVWRGKVVS